MNTLQPQPSAVTWRVSDDRYTLCLITPMGLAPILWFDQTEDFLRFVAETNVFSKLTVPSVLRQSIQVAQDTPES